MAKIYVVEDEPSLRMLYQAEITAMGHEVILKSNGRDAFKSLLVDHPDLIVLDIQMPEGDGMSFLTKTLDTRIGIPIIINTAYSHYKDDFMSSAAEAYVVKSSDLTELKSKINDILGKKAEA